MVLTRIMVDIIGIMVMGKIKTEKKVYFTDYNPFSEIAKDSVIKKL